MSTTGTAVFFDGLTSRRQDVHVSLEHELVILRPDGSRLDGWPYDQLRELSAPGSLLRLTREGGPTLARLEIRDEALAAETRARSGRLAATRAAEAGTTRKVVFWSLFAVVSLTIFGFFGIPQIAEALTPVLPWSVDQRMGRAADGQLRSILPIEPGGDFACGAGSEERAGREALDRLAKKLSDAAALPVPIEIVAVRSDMINALALPGSPIYLMDGLIQKAETGDEIAGVLSHEIGHVAHRDGTRHALAAGGSSLLFGFILGDFVGGAAAIAIVRAVSEASYSREAERQADAYGVDLMKSLKGDGKAVGTLLTRLTTQDKEETEKARRDEAKKSGKDDGKADAAAEGRSIMDWIASHPNTVERQRLIDARAGDAPVAPIMDQADFLAIKRICGHKK